MDGEISKIWLLRCYKGEGVMNNKTSEIAGKIVNAYFEKTDKTLKEIFEEYTEDLTPEEIERFYINLKIILN
jgi:hypothetical protein